MAVDHGLGGKDNRKSKEKRAKRLAKKAAKAKFEAKSFETKTKKREIVFDENSRLEYLTGFGKRKKERRQFGLAMQVLKDKKMLKDKKVKLGSLLSEENRSNIGRSADAGTNDDDEEEDSTSQVETTHEKSLFSDELTTSMFGGEVEVAIDNSLAELLDEASCVTFLKDSNAKVGYQKPELTPFDRAMKKAKHIMHVKAIDKRNKVKYAL